MSSVSAAESPGLPTVGGEILGCEDALVDRNRKIFKILEESLRTPHNREKSLRTPQNREESLRTPHNRDGVEKPRRHCKTLEENSVSSRHCINLKENSVSSRHCINLKENTVFLKYTKKLYTSLLWAT